MSEPSSFFEQHREELRATAALGPLLDLACGRGRHALAAARDGAPTLAVDRNPDFLRELSDRAREGALPLRALRADLESGPAIPLRPGSCGAVLVFRFLSRPLAAQIEQVLAPGGLLLYETFTIHQRELGYGPSNPSFLLRPGELPGLFPGLEPIYSWEGLTHGDKPWAVARLAARRTAPASR